jgi:rhodanese-related sulfurtransferase
MLKITIMGLLMLLLAACQSSDNPNQSATPAAYQTFTIDEFASIVDNESDAFTIVNVHIPYEGEVANTDAFVAYNDLDALTAALPDKNAPIILYCRSGHMSKLASDDLLELGYTNVHDVPGGMVAWASSGRDLITR